MTNQNELPDCLQNLTRDQKEQLQMTLANDEASSDEEVIALWVNECGIPQESAEAAIKYRPQFFVNPILDLFSLFD